MGLPGGGSAAAFTAFCSSGQGSDAFVATATASSLTINVGTAFSLSTAGGSSYSWSAPAGATLTSSASSSVVSASLTTTGIKTFTVVVSNGGTCSQTATVSVTGKGLPDLTATFYVTPTVVYGNTTCSLVVDVVELSGTTTNGLIQIRITKDPSLNLSLVGTATMVGGRSVQNSLWSLDGLSESNFYVLTTTQPIGGAGKLSVGLTGVLNPGNTSGNLTITGLVLGSGVGEVKTNNNSGAVKIDYFNK